MRAHCRPPYDPKWLVGWLLKNAQRSSVLLLCVEDACIDSKTLSVQGQGLVTQPCRKKSMAPFNTLILCRLCNALVEAAAWNPCTEQPHNSINPSMTIISVSHAHNLVVVVVVVVRHQQQPQLPYVALDKLKRLCVACGAPYAGGCSSLGGAGAPDVVPSRHPMDRQVQPCRRHHAHELP